MVRRYIVIGLVALVVTAGAACTDVRSTTDPTSTATPQPTATPTPVLDVTTRTPAASETESVVDASSQIGTTPAKTEPASGSRQATSGGGGFAIALDGPGFVGLVQSFSGGNIVGDVALVPLERDNIEKKHLSGISYEPFTIEVGMGMSAGFYEWISSSFDTGYVTRIGEVYSCDLDYNCLSVRQFVDAYISEVTIPTLDGSSMEPAYMTVKLEPERIFYTEDSGGQITGEVALATKKWQNSNFRVEIGDLPTTLVAKIDSFTWKQSVIEDDIGGGFRDPIIGSAPAEVPNLRLTISMVDVTAWQDWHRSFVIEGRASDADERTGRIVFLGSDMREELASIDLLNVGIISLESLGQEASRDELATFTVELYVEQMKFNYG